MTEESVIDLAEIALDAENARHHSEDNLTMIRRSLAEYRAGRSILIDGENTLIAGEGVTRAARELGYTRVRVIDTDGSELIAVRRADLTAAQRRRLALLDNRTTETSTWDNDVLAEFFHEDPAILDGIFTNGELSALLNPKKRSRGTVDVAAHPDISAELQKRWMVETGQIWQVGAHRLMCGDSTKNNDVAQLITQRVAMTFTSPPYNAGGSANLRENNAVTNGLYRVGFDDDKSQADYLTFLEQFTELALRYSEYVFVNIQLLAGNKRAVIEYLAHFTAANNFADVAIWDKQGVGVPQIAPRVMNSRYEFILIFSESGNKTVGTRYFQGTVPNVYVGNQQLNNEFADSHGATFPLDLPLHFIDTFTNVGDAVYEPFCGTGTTLLACEELCRTGYGMELYPEYCAVTLQRLTDAGLEAKLLE